MKRLCFALIGILVFFVMSLSAQQRTLRIEIFDRGNVPPGTLENGPPAKWIQKEFGDPNNVKIEWVLVPRAKEVEKLNIMMAAGDAPDIVFTYDAVLVSSYVTKGGLTDLTDLIKKNGSTLSSFLGNTVLDFGRFEGKQFALPGKRQLNGITGSWIRKDWLDKLGLPLPKTTDQWLAAVRAFRDKDPGKVGTNLAPIGGGGVDPSIMYSFYKPSTERDRSAWIGPSSTRPARDLAIPGAKDAFRFLNMLQNEGLMQKDWALWPKNDQLNLNATLSNGWAGAFTHNSAYLWFYNLIPAIQKNAPQSVWAPIDPFTNAEGKTAKFVYSPIGIFTFVPKFSKNADLAVKYLNWMADLKNLKKLMFGDEGVHYDLNKDGIIIPRKLSGDQAWELGNILDRAIILNGRPYDNLDKAILAQILPWVDNTYTASMFTEHYKMIEKDGIAPVRLENPPDSLDKLGPMLLDKAEELAKKIILAKPADFDATFEAALKEWLDLGARKVKEDMLKQYDLEHKTR